MQPDLSVIIVSHECAGVLADCLESLLGRPWSVSTEIILVDNASTDGTADRVCGRFGQVRLIANAINRGFAAANNQGLAVATGRHVLFLNPDTRVHAGSLEMLVRTLDGDPTIGALGPQLLNADGSIQSSVRGLPTAAALLHQYTPLRMLRLLGPAYRRYKMSDFDGRTPADVGSVSGAALCVPRRLLDQVGPMDERFFVFFEEVDLCRRILEAGRRVRFDPAGRITHLGGVSSRHADVSVYVIRSLLAYMWKWHSLPAALAINAALWSGVLARESLQLVGNLAAGLALAALGRSDRAGRRLRRARAAARFVFRDGWRSILKH